MSAPPVLVRGAWVLTMDGGDDALPDAAVAVSADGRIAAVGPYGALAARFPGAETVGDGSGVVLPGMVNLHNHLSEGLFPGIGETTSLWEWYVRVVEPTNRALTRDDVRVGARLKAAEMLCSGITTVNDMSCHRNPGSLASLGAADALRDLGMRGVVCFGAVDVYDGAPPPHAYLAEHEALADVASAAPLLSFRLGLAGVLAVSDPLYERSLHACSANGWAVHVHLQEVREEVTEARIRHRCGTIGYAHRTGLLDHGVVAAHCVWCNEADVSLLASRDVAVAHNPVANMILGSGVCPVPRLLAGGVTVGLGTDGAASNDNQDMFGVLKTAALLQKVAALDPAVITARDVVRMATIDGARALGLEREIGSLAAGKRADVVLLAGDTPELATIHEPFSQVVYCATARCVSDVWVDGARRVADGSLLGASTAGLAREARAAGRDLAVRAGLGAASAYTDQKETR